MEQLFQGSSMPGGATVQPNYNPPMSNLGPNSSEHLPGCALLVVIIIFLIILFRLKWKLKPKANGPMTGLVREAAQPTPTPSFDS